MYKERYRVRQLEYCNKQMFGNLIVTCPGYASHMPKELIQPVPITVKPVINPRESAQSHLMEAEKRRTSLLVDQLLLDIHNSIQHGTDYNSTTSGKSSQKYCKVQCHDLYKRDLDDLSALVDLLGGQIERVGVKLVRRLKRREVLRRQQEAHCDVITCQLRKLLPNTAEDMCFTVNPQSGESGFSQWVTAMKMVSQLPGGIPPEFRKRLWLTMAEKHLVSKGVDWQRVERTCFSEWSHPDDGELGVQIVKDLHRTGCSLFCGEGGQENQALLKKVLLAYARWNKAVGYCQGFNMLAALILQVTDKSETDALKLMIYLIEGVLPDSYFADSLRGLSVDMAVFRELLRTRLPRLSKHLDLLQNMAKEGTTSYEPPLTNVFTMQWFLTLFCNCLPQPSVLRVWDLILLEGNEMLLRTALAIWQALADRILRVRTADEFYCIMGLLTNELLENNLIDANTLIKAVVAVGPLTELKSLREHYLYNINPWGAVPSSLFSEKQLKLYPRERLALDISALKKQYMKLKQRQRQAHIIFSAAISRHPPPRAPVAMNHLLLGKSALVPAKRLGPPKGSIPPARVPSTLLWKDTKQNSSSSSSDTELCDEDNVPSESSDDSNQKSPTDELPEDNPPHSDASCVKDTDPNSENEISAKIDVIEDKQTSDESDIFSSVIDNHNEFDIEKVIDIDSEEDSVDFELFLEDRVKCLKQESPTEEENRVSLSRRNSERALQIIQENSLILHRILQCQSRLSMSPPATDTCLDTDDDTTSKKSLDSHRYAGDGMFSQSLSNSEDSTCHSTDTVDNCTKIDELFDFIDLSLPKITKSNSPKEDQLKYGSKYDEIFAKSKSLDDKYNDLILNSNVKLEENFEKNGMRQSKTFTNEEDLLLETSDVKFDSDVFEDETPKASENFFPGLDSLSAHNNVEPWLENIDTGRPETPRTEEINEPYNLYSFGKMSASNSKEDIQSINDSRPEETNSIESSIDLIFDSTKKAMNSDFSLIGVKTSFSEKSDTKTDDETVSRVFEVFSSNRTITPNELSNDVTNDSLNTEPKYNLSFSSKSLHSTSNFIPDSGVEKRSLSATNSIERSYVTDYRRTLSATSSIERVPSPSSGIIEEVCECKDDSLNDEPQYTKSFSSKSLLSISDFRSDSGVEKKSSSATNSIERSDITEYRRSLSATSSIDRVPSPSSGIIEEVCESNDDSSNLEPQYNKSFISKSLLSTSDFRSDSGVEKRSLSTTKSIGGSDITEYRRSLSATSSIDRVPSPSSGIIEEVCECKDDSSNDEPQYTKSFSSKSLLSTSDFRSDSGVEKRSLSATNSIERSDITEYRRSHSATSSIDRVPSPSFGIIEDPCKSKDDSSNAQAQYNTAFKSKSLLSTSNVRSDRVVEERSLSPSNPIERSDVPDYRKSLSATSSIDRVPSPLSRVIEDVCESKDDSLNAESQYDRSLISKSLLSTSNFRSESGIEKKSLSATNSIEKSDITDYKRSLSATSSIHRVLSPSSGIIKDVCESKDDSANAEPKYNISLISKSLLSTSNFSSDSGIEKRSLSATNSIERSDVTDYRRSLSATSSIDRVPSPSSGNREDVCESKDDSYLRLKKTIKSPEVPYESSYFSPRYQTISSNSTELKYPNSNSSISDNFDSSSRFNAASLDTDINLYSRNSPINTCHLNYDKMPQGVKYFEEGSSSTTDVKNTNSAEKPLDEIPVHSPSRRTFLETKSILDDLQMKSQDLAKISSAEKSPRSPCISSKSDFVSTERLINFECVDLPQTSTEKTSNFSPIASGTKQSEENDYSLRISRSPNIFFPESNSNFTTSPEKSRSSSVVSPVGRSTASPEIYHKSSRTSSPCVRNEKNLEDETDSLKITSERNYEPSRFSPSIRHESSPEEVSTVFEGSMRNISSPERNYDFHRSSSSRSDRSQDDASPKSPSKIFNPFPVPLNSRQKKEVGVKLGLYKK